MASSSSDEETEGLLAVLAARRRQNRQQQQQQQDITQRRTRPIIKANERLQHVTIQQPGPVSRMQNVLNQATGHLRSITAAAATPLDSFSRNHGELVREVLYVNEQLVSSESREIVPYTTNQVVSQVQQAYSEADSMVANFANEPVLGSATLRLPTGTINMVVTTHEAVDALARLATQQHKQEMEQAKTQNSHQLALVDRQHRNRMAELTLATSLVHSDNETKKYLSDTKSRQMTIAKDHEIGLVKVKGEIAIANRSNKVFIFASGSILIIMSAAGGYGWYNEYYRLSHFVALMGSTMTGHAAYKIAVADRTNASAARTSVELAAVSALIPLMFAGIAGTELVAMGEATIKVVVGDYVKPLLGWGWTGIGYGASAIWSYVPSNPFSSGTALSPLKGDGDVSGDKEEEEDDDDDQYMIKGILEASMIVASHMIAGLLEVEQLDDDGFIRCCEAINESADIIQELNLLRGDLKAQQLIEYGTRVILQPSKPFVRIKNNGDERSQRVLFNPNNNGGDLKPKLKLLKPFVSIKIREIEQNKTTLFDPKTNQPVGTVHEYITSAHLVDVHLTQMTHLNLLHSARRLVKESHSACVITTHPSWRVITIGCLKTMKVVASTRFVIPLRDVDQDHRSITTIQVLSLTTDPRPITSLYFRITNEGIPNPRHISSMAHHKPPSTMVPILDNMNIYQMSLTIQCLVQIAASGERFLQGLQKLSVDKYRERYEFEGCVKALCATLSAWSPAINSQAVKVFKYVNHEHLNEENGGGPLVVFYSPSSARGFMVLPVTRFNRNLNVPAVRHSTDNYPWLDYNGNLVRIVEYKMNKGSTSIIIFKPNESETHRLLVFMRQNIKLVSHMLVNSNGKWTDWGRRWVKRQGNRCIALVDNSDSDRHSFTFRAHSSIIDKL